MVQYLPSQATGEINVITSEVGTVLTLTVPPEPVVQEDPFLITGELRRVDTNALLSGETITATFNGTALGSDTTMNGTYNIDGVINEVGLYTITVNFAGSTRPGLTLRPSQGIWSVNIGGGLKVPLMIGATATLGVLLIMLAK